MPKRLVSWWFTLIAVASSATSEDTVRLKPDMPGRNDVVARGEIIDWTGEAMIVRRPSGSERRYDAARVTHVETTWPKEYRAGKTSYAKREFEKAVRELVAASRLESRPWARRQILHQLMLAYEAVGETARACDMFLALVQSDPSTPAFRDAPLAWLPDVPLERPAALALMNRRQSPVEMLLGASHLLTTTQRSQAEKALVELIASDDPRIAALAEAQLWRMKIVTATADDVARWSERTELMPVDVRSGAYFVVAEGWRRLGRNDEAVLAYLRVPILYPSRRALAARALVSAARVSHEAGRPREAARLLREVASEYPDRPERSEAEQLLNSLEPG